MSPRPPPISTVTILRERAVACLIAANTIAGDQVDDSRTLPFVSKKATQGPTQPPADALPYLNVETFDELGAGKAPKMTEPAFETTLTLVISGAVETRSERGTACASDLLIEQAKEALFSSTTFFAPPIEGFKSFQVERKYSTKAGLFLCEFRLGIELLYTEIFAPVIPTPFAGVNLYLDLVNLYDPTGTYTPPFAYEPTTAPRTSGPDGRVEIGAIIDLPQD